MMKEESSSKRQSQTVNLHRRGRMGGHREEVAMQHNSVMNQIKAARREDHSVSNRNNVYPARDSRDPSIQKFDVLSARRWVTMLVNVQRILQFVSTAAMQVIISEIV